MQIQIAILMSLFTFQVLAAPNDTSFKELFNKYERVMDSQEVELVDDVFSKKFLEGNGGKEQFIKELKTMPKPKEKSPPLTFTWRKGVRGKIYFAKVKEPSDKKSKTEGPTSEFIIVEEDGKLKIEGTLSDGE